MNQRRLAWALGALLLAATACSTTNEDSAMVTAGSQVSEVAFVDDDRVEGDAVAFCPAWDDISALLAQIDEEEPTPELFDELVAAMAEADADVPVAIRDDWDAVRAFLLPFGEVMVTVEYDVDLINDEILELAFGSADTVETLERASNAGVDAIEAWSLAGCGDFCARWPDTREAFEHTGGDLGWVFDQGEQARDVYQQMLGRIAIADELVPDELAAKWEQLLVVNAENIGLWEQFGFDRERVQSPEAREAAVVAAEAPWFAEVAYEFYEMQGMPEQDRESALNDAQAHPEQTHDFWMGSLFEWMWRELDQIGEWVDANCDQAGNRPGHLQVTWPTIEGAAGSQVILSLMPKGSTFEDISETGSSMAAYCASVSTDPWGVEVDGEGQRHASTSEHFLTYRGGSHWCDLDWEAGPAQIPAGDYTLLTLVADVGGENMIGAATACLALDVHIDGDTVVELPEPPACDADLTSLMIDPDPWRTPAAVDPSTPGAGTLQVVIPSLATLDAGNVHGGQLQMIVLPAGTTLNQVGREQVWPSGAVQLWLVPGGSQQERELARFGPVSVPIMELAPAGTICCLDPHWLAQGPPEDRLSLVLLAPGAYDVYVQVESHVEEGEELQWCTSFEVEIDGDTVVELPELEECP